MTTSWPRWLAALIAFVGIVGCGLSTLLPGAQWALQPKDSPLVERPSEYWLYMVLFTLSVAAFLIALFVLLTGRSKPSVLGFAGIAAGLWATTLWQVWDNGWSPFFSYGGPVAVAMTLAIMAFSIVSKRVR